MRACGRQRCCVDAGGARLPNSGTVRTPCSRPPLATGESVCVREKEGVSGPNSCRERAFTRWERVTGERAG